MEGSLQRDRGLTVNSQSKSVRATRPGEQEWEGHASGEQQGQGGEQESQMAKPGLTKGWKPHGQPWGVRPERALDTELRDWTSVQWSTVVRAVSDHDREVMGDAGSSSLERPLRSVLHHVTGRRPHQCLWAASNPKPHRTVQLTGVEGSTGGFAFSRLAVGAAVPKGRICRLVGRMFPRF